MSDVDQAAQPQSIMDRIAAQFEIRDDEARTDAEYDGRPYEVKAPVEEPEQEAEVAVSEDVEVEYDGQRYKVPKGLEKAILQEKDYTQKTQTLAEQRKQVEYAQKALEASRMEREFGESVAQELQQIQLMDSYLQQLKSVDVNSLGMEDGFKHWMQMQQLKEQRETLNQNVEGKRTEYQKKVKAHLDTLKSEARDLLAKQIPGFSDETASQLSSHAKSLGYTDADVEMIQLDPRASSLLYKAMKFDQLQASASTAVQKVNSPVVKPGASNPMPQRVKDQFAYQKAMKSAKTSQEKARLIEQRLANSF